MCETYCCLVFLIPMSPLLEAAHTAQVLSALVLLSFPCSASLEEETLVCNPS